MPLSPGSSNAVKSKNISEMVRAGHPQDQAIAAAYANAKRHPSRKSKGGGKMGSSWKASRRSAREAEVTSEPCHSP